MKNYRHRETFVVVEAIRFTGGNDYDVRVFAKATSAILRCDPAESITLTTESGPLFALAGYWFVRDANGGPIAIMMPSEFDASYELAGYQRCANGPDRHPEPLNLWDSFNPRELKNGDDMSNYGGGIRLRLFGNRNVGTTMRTNILQAGVVERDTEYIVTNWYARTNILAPPAEFHAFASGTIVTLTVGKMPVHRMSLADLMQRKTGRPYRNHWQPESSDSLARRMYIEVHSHSQDDYEAAKAAWETDLVDRNLWRSIAHAANEIVSPAILALIPQCQNYDVIVTADKRALGALLEVLPTNVAPETLVWIHLEGVRRVIS